MGQQARKLDRDAHTAEAERAGHAATGRTRIGTGQHDAGALSERLTDIATTRKPLQTGGFSGVQVRARRFGTARNRHLCADNADTREPMYKQELNCHVGP